ncbi:4-phosphoerythronate dehydrogenase [Nitrospira sp. MA-1]|nr:4-phosphoerythronate dehydrogenase [Nitrospira sp. MA-1]
MKKLINIVAGENIPYIKEACAGLGNLTLLPGRSITSNDLKDTNLILIRSITKVDETLLKGTPVEFVGSASAGVDHIDIAYLKARNIGFTSAAGSNANSVAEYVLASLLFLGKQQSFSLNGKTIGIIGVGNIGKLVKTKAEALGMVPVLHDPPLADSGQVEHRSLAEALSCDVVTLHTPLTTDGPYPTYHMLNEQTLQWLNPAAIFINAARGEVVETQALLNAITENRVGPTIIDVWEDEPGINWDLFQAVTIGTPHIAGHSLDGKANGTFMIYEALCKHLGISPAWNPVQVLPTPTVPSLTIDYHEQSDEELIQEMVATIYDLEADYHRMQELLAIPQEKRPQCFDELRKNYPVRREFHRTNVTLPKNQERLQQLLAGVGFLEFSEEG